MLSLGQLNEVTTVVNSEVDADKLEVSFLNVIFTVLLNIVPGGVDGITNTVMFIVIDSPDVRLPMSYGLPPGGWELINVTLGSRKSKTITFVTLKSSVLFTRIV